MAIVGTAYVQIKAITKDIGRDISRSLSGINDSPLANLATTAQLAGNAMVVAGAGVSSLVSGLGAVAAAGAQAGAALAVLPASMVALAQGGVTLAVAMKGVSEAISAGLQPAQARTNSRAIQGAMRGIETAARGVVNAQRQVENAQRGVRDALQGVQRAQRGVADAQDKVRDASENMSTVFRENQRRMADAVEDVEDAENNLRTAQQASRIAQLSLNAARDAARETLQQLAFSAEDAALAERRAGLNLEEAHAALVAAQRLPPDDRRRREAQLSYEEAELAYREAKDRNADLAVEQQNAARRGVEGSQEVQRAQESIAETRRREAEAQEGVADAREARDEVAISNAERARDATQRLAEANEGVEEAQLRVADAEENVADARRRVADATQGVTDAQDRLRDAQQRLKDEQSGVNGAIDQYQRKLAALPPAQQAFVRQMVAMKGEFNALRQAAGENLFPALGRAVTQVSNTFFPILADAFRSTGGVIGDFAEKVAGFMTSPFFTGAFTTIARSNDRILTLFGDTAINLARAFTTLLLAVQPLTQRFAEWLVRLSTEFNTFLAGVNGADGQGLTRFFNSAGDAAAVFGEALRPVFGIIWDIGKAAAPVGLGLVKSFGDAAERVRAFTSSGEGADALSEHFRAVGENVRAIGGLVGDLALIFLRLGASPGVVATVNILREQLVPIIDRLVTLTADTAGPALANFAVAIGRVLETVANAGVLNTFVNTLTWIVNAAGGVATALGNAGLLGPLLTGLAVLKGFSVALGFMGIRMNLLSTIGSRVLMPLLTMLMVRIRMVALAIRFAAMTAGGPVVAGVVIAITAIAAALIYAYTHSERFRGFVQQLIEYLRTGWDYALAGIRVFVGFVVDAFQFLADILFNRSIIPDLINGIVGAFNTLVSTVGPIVRGFVAVVMAIFNAFKDNVGPIVQELVNGVMGIFDQFKGFGTEIFGGVQTAVGGLQSGFVAIQPVLSAVAGAFVAFGRAVGQALVFIAPFVGQIVGFFLRLIPPALRFFFTAVRVYFNLAFAVIRFVIQSIWFLISNVLLPVIRGIIAVVQFVFPIVVAIIRTAFAIIGVYIRAAAWVFTNVLIPAFRILFAVGSAIFNGLMVLIRVAIVIISAIIMRVLVPILRATLIPAFQLIWIVASLVFRLVRLGFAALAAAINVVVTRFIAPILTRLVNGFGAIWTKMKSVRDDVRKAWDNVWTKIRDVVDLNISPKVDTLKGKFGEIYDKIKGVVRDFKTKFEEIGSAIKTQYDKYIAPRVKWIKDKFGEIYTKIDGVVTNVGKSLNNLASAPQKGVTGLLNLINTHLIGNLNKITSKFGFTVGTINVPTFAEGGYVRGRGGPKDDRVAALLSNKEFVVNAKQTGRYRALLEAINSGRDPHVPLIAPLGGWNPFKGVKNGVESIMAKGIGLTMDKIISPFVDLFVPNTGSFVNTFFRAMIPHFMKKVKEWGKERDKEFFPEGGMLGPGRTGAYGGVKPWVAAVGDVTKKTFPGIRGIGGVGGRPNKSDHPMGLALDFMVYQNRALGNKIAEFLMRSRDPFSIKYLIWYDRIASKSRGWGWRAYTHPNGNLNPTLRHEDHVHASFLNPPNRAPSGGYTTGGGPPAAGNAKRPTPGAYRNTRLGNARVIAQVAYENRNTVRDVLIALMTAFQESGLRNLRYGDRDSLGLFQQRPSQGWGSRSQILNPRYSALKFLQALGRVYNRRSMGLGQAAQRVQRSRFPRAYAKWEGDARSLMKQLGVFDTGGMLRGGRIALNLSSKPERVLNPRQTAAFEKLLPLLKAIKLQDGGTVAARRGGTIALIGEAGRNERVTPLDRNGYSRGEAAMIRELAAMRADITALQRGDHYEIHPAPGMNEGELASMVSRRVAFNRRSGT